MESGVLIFDMHLRRRDRVELWNKCSCSENTWGTYCILKIGQDFISLTSKPDFARKAVISKRVTHPPLPVPQCGGAATPPQMVSVESSRGHRSPCGHSRSPGHPRPAALTLPVPCLQQELLGVASPSVSWWWTSLIVAHLSHFAHFLFFFLSYFLPVAWLVLLHLFMETLRTWNPVNKPASSGEAECQSRGGCWGCPEALQGLAFPRVSPGETLL